MTLNADPTAVGFGRYLALFLPISWAWAGFAFYATRFDTDDLVYRLLTLLGMFFVAALASTVPDALHGGQNSFVVAYVAVRLVLLMLTRVSTATSRSPAQSRGGCYSSSAPRSAYGWSRSRCRRRGSTRCGDWLSCSSTGHPSRCGSSCAACLSTRGICRSASGC
jgi:hypothetical protein